MAEAGNFGAFVTAQIRQAGPSLVLYRADDQEEQASGSVDRIIQV